MPTGKANHGKPLLYKNGVGQYDLDNNLVNEFTCKYDCIRELKMSDKSLTKALEKDYKKSLLLQQKQRNKLKLL